MSDEKRVNNKIRSPKVVLISADGQNLGEMETRFALQRAREVGMDLVEISDQKGLPVCKILDYGKWKYAQSKKEKANKPTKQVTKEIKLRPTTDDNDLSYRSKHVKEFLHDGDKVKLTVRFKGREQAHMFETGRAMLEKFILLLDGESFNQSDAVVEGRNISITLHPAKGKSNDIANSNE